MGKNKEEKLSPLHRRLGLVVPGYLSAHWVKLTRRVANMSLNDFASVLGSTDVGVATWERQAVSPGFPSVVVMLDIELGNLATTESGDNSVLDPRETLLGRIILNGTLNPDEVRHALERLAEVLWVHPDLSEPVAEVEKEAVGV